MPSYAAGPRPATVRLAQTSSQCIKETFNRYLPLPSSATRPANSVALKPQIIARNRVRPRRSHKPSRSNLHSAPQPPVSLTAVSFPGGFRTPAPVQADRPDGPSSETLHTRRPTALQQSNYSITSSAVASSTCGMVRPSALAVLRLITSSNLVGSSIGRSPGLAPFKILSTKLATRRKPSETSIP